MLPFCVYEELMQTHYLLSVRNESLKCCRDWDEAQDVEEKGDMESVRITSFTGE
jgi:hypothetical protein